MACINPASGIGPARHAGGADAVGRIPVEDEDFGIEVGISGKRLALAVDEELIGRKVVRNLGLENAILVWSPGEIQLAPTADDDMLARGGLPDDGRLLRTRVFRGERQRVIEGSKVPALKVMVIGSRPLVLSARATFCAPGKRLERLVSRACIVVGTGWADKQL